MCKYCEIGKRCDADACNLNYREKLTIKLKSSEHNISYMSTTATIITPTPITLKRNTDGLAGKMHIHLYDEQSKTLLMDIPIRYCPICGRDLSKQE